MHSSSCMHADAQWRPQLRRYPSYSMYLFLRSATAVLPRARARSRTSSLSFTQTRLLSPAGGALGTVGRAAQPAIALTADHSSWTHCYRQQPFLRCSSSLYPTTSRGSKGIAGSRSSSTRSGGKGRRPARLATAAAAAAARHDFFATCHPGLEETVAEQLLSPAVAAERVETGRGGVHFSGRSLETGYKANLWLRSAIRVLLLLHEGEIDPDIPSGDTIYEFFRGAAAWPDLIPPGATFSIDARVAQCPSVPGPLLVQKRGKDAICDALVDARSAPALTPPCAHRQPTFPSTAPCSRTV